LVQKSISSRASKQASILHTPPNSPSHPPFLEALHSPLQMWTPPFSLLSHTRFRCNLGGERLRPAARPGLGAVSESPARALARLHRTWSKMTRPRAQEEHSSPRLPRPRAHGHEGGSESVGGSTCTVLEPPEYGTARGAVRSVLQCWI
jgi:hypothetical protein